MNLKKLKKSFSFVVFLILFVILMYLSSCNPKTELNFNKGTNSIYLDVNSFVDRVNRNNVFPIKLSISNDGAQDAKLMISVFYPFPYLSFVRADNLNVINDKKKHSLIIKDLYLKGKSVEHPYNDKLIGILYFKANLPEMQSRKSVELSFDYCYLYKTSVGTQLCINPDYNLKSVEETCKVEPIILSGGQGSIISVSQIDISEVKNENNKVNVHLTIKINNNGNGNIAPFVDDDLSKCFSSDYDKDLFKQKKIKITKILLGSKEIKSLENKIVDINDDSSFDIDFTINNYEAPYLANFIIEFQYIYEDHKSVFLDIT